MKISIGFRIEGLDYCDIAEQKITGLNHKLFEQAKIVQKEGRKFCNVEFLINGNLEKKEFDEQKGIIILEAKEAVKKIIALLIQEEFDIINWQISEPSITIEDNGKMCAQSSITIENIDAEMQVKSYKKTNFSLEEKISKEQQEIVDILNVLDDVIRYEFLYEKLKQNCGNQINVIKKIKEKYPCIATDNHNIDSKFWNGNQEYQDDFTYLRTLISHGKTENYEEINKRILRDTNRIVKVLFDLEKEENLYPQDKKDAKTRVIAKKYKVNKKVAEEFQIACKQRGIAMGTQLTKMMKEFIDQQEHSE